MDVSGKTRVLPGHIHCIANDYSLSVLFIFSADNIKTLNIMFLFQNPEKYNGEKQKMGCFCFVRLRRINIGERALWEISQTWENEKKITNFRMIMTR